jgi:hypothetical protein
MRTVHQGGGSAKDRSEGLAAMAHIQIGKEVLFKVIWFRHLGCWYLFVRGLVSWSCEGPTLWWRACRTEAPISVDQRCLEMPERPLDKSHDAKFCRYERILKLNAADKR